MCTSKHKSVSYRRNRDYSKQLNWTYELNEDLYKCYTEAREVPKKGYMARMKKNVGQTSPGTKPETRNEHIFYKLLTLLIATQKT